MNPNELFDIWAPADCIWSPWVKPVLFTWIGAAKEKTLPPSPDWNFDWLSAVAKDTALVLDLPGPESVALSLRLASLGCRPIPLFNAIPSESPAAVGDEEEAPALVDAMGIVRAMRAATPELSRLPLPADAPPAFLLNSLRRGPSSRMEPPYFDNRSLSFPTDFPSANFLRAHGIRRAVLVQREQGQPASDLAHTLRGWIEGGVAVEIQTGASASPIPCNVPRPSRFRLWFHRALETLGFQRSVLGGFGGVLEEASAG